MAHLSKFDPKLNPLGTQNLEETYLVTTENITVVQLSASVIMAQPILDISDLDMKLATLINAYQDRLKSNAKFFLAKLIPEYVTVVIDASNFSALVNASYSILRNEINEAYENPTVALHASRTFTHLSAQAGEVWVDVHSLNSSYMAGEKSIERYAKDYATDLSEVIELLGETTKKITLKIEEIQENIAQNIKDIVEGSKELGGAVTELGMGILTTISGAVEVPKPKEDDDNDDDEDGNDEKDKSSQEEGDGQEKEPLEAPNVEYAIHSIQAGTSGTAKASTAVQELKANNKKLAAAFQELARENVLVAIAKAVEAQNELYLDAFAQLGSDIHDLSTEWAVIEPAYTKYAQDVKSIRNQSESIEMGAELQGAKTLWSALNGQLMYIRKNMSGNI